MEVDAPVAEQPDETQSLRDQLARQVERLSARPGAALERRGRPSLLLIYLVLAALLLLIAFGIHLLHPSAVAGFQGRVLEPYGIAGLVFFGGRSLLRTRLRWCRACGRWLAVEPAGEKVVRTRPVVRHNQGEIHSFNAKGQRMSTSRSSSVARGVIETVEVTVVCRHCGAERVFKERRER